MTREEIERLEGRHLDAAVEEAVFGRPTVFVLRGGVSIPVSRGVRGVEQYVPGYSEHLGWSWEVVEAMRRRGYWFEVDEMTCPPEHPCDIRCRFVRNTHDVRERLDNTYAGSCSLATAICRASLIAVTNEEGEDGADA